MGCIYQTPTDYLALVGAAIIAALYVLDNWCIHAKRGRRLLNLASMVLLFAGFCLHRALWAGACRYDELVNAQWIPAADPGSRVIIYYALAFIVPALVLAPTVLLNIVVERRLARQERAREECAPIRVAVPAGVTVRRA